MTTKTQMPEGLEKKREELAEDLELDLSKTRGQEFTEIDGFIYGFNACFEALCGENFGLRIIELLSERRELGEKVARLEAALEKADERLRQMHRDGEITVQEMIVALKPVMWVSGALKSQGDEELKAALKKWQRELKS